MTVPSQSHAQNVINSVSLEKNSYGVGETVYWNIDAACTTSSINQLYIAFTDPTGLYQIANTPGLNGKAPGKTSPKGPFKVPLKITTEASPGKYTVQGVNLSCVNAQSQTSWEDNLDSISFTVLPDGLTPAVTQPQLEKIEMTTPSDRKAGDKISIRVVASNTGKINTIWLFLRNQQEGTEVFKLLSKYDSNISGPDTKRIDNTFDFEVGPDWPSGTWTVSKVEITGYAGIDLSTPWGADPNPTNSTAVFNRSVSILNMPGQKTWGQPISGAVQQADISAIKINVSNDAAVALAAPEISNVNLSTTVIKAGDSFDMTMDIDGKGANIYQVFGNWADKETYNKGGASCYIKDLGATPFVTKMLGVTVTCKSTRTSEPGIYVMRQLSVYTTSCSGTIRDISSSDNQDCQSQPKQRRTNYSNAYGSSSVDSVPISKVKMLNPLQTLAQLTIQAPGTLTRPALQSATATDSRIVFKYTLDYDLICTYSANSGTVSSDGMKGDGSVTVSKVKPATEVKLSGSCRSSDGQSTSFSDIAKTTLPKPPILPMAVNTEADLDSVKITFDELNADGYSYDVSTSAGDLFVLGDDVEITELDPGQSVDITIRITDPYGQVSEGIVTTVKSAAAPLLVKPRVSLVKSTKGSYLFKFTKLPKVKYQVVAINCVARIDGDQIQITNFVKKKPASATLVASDTFKQSVSNKFLQYKSR
jgi:hypothetical protein